MIRYRFILIILLSVIFLSLGYADEYTNVRLPSGVNIYFVEGTFVKSDFNVEGCSGHESKCKINGRIPFGTDVELPKTYLKTIEASFAGKTHNLNTSDMYNAWGKRPLEYKNSIRYFGGKCFDSMNCQLRGLFSDGAGTFVAEWRIVNGVSTRTVLTDSNDIVGLFMEHIDPPEYE